MPRSDAVAVKSEPAFNSNDSENKTSLNDPMEASTCHSTVAPDPAFPFSPTKAAHCATTSADLSAFRQTASVKPEIEGADAGSDVGDESATDSIDSWRKSTPEGEQLLAKRKPKSADEIAVVKPTRKKRRSSCLTGPQLLQRHPQQQQDATTMQKRRHSTPARQSRNEVAEQELSTISLKDLGTDLEALEAFRRRREEKEEDEDRWKDSTVREDEEENAEDEDENGAEPLEVPQV